MVEVVLLTGDCGAEALALSRTLVLRLDLVLGVEFVKWNTCGLLILECSGLSFFEWSENLERDGGSRSATVPGSRAEVRHSTFKRFIFL